MSFTGYLCWKPESVGDVVVYDAVMPSDAIFLATHTSAPILRSEFQTTAAGTLCTEQDLLGYFVGTRADLLLVPIVGQSGRGKSHIVRWLRINIPENNSRHVVYVPKYNTSLRGVVEEILRGLEGSTADQLRADLARAADDVNESTAPEKLLYALALRIQNQTVRPVPGSAKGKPTKNDVGYREFATEWLPELLRDHTFRGTLLSKETGVITRFAHEAMRGRSKEDREKPFAFEEGDLPCNVNDVVASAGQKVGKFYSHFVANRNLRLVCLELLNEHLGPAVAEVIGLRSGALYRILLDLRRLLLEQKKELVLLIEDFTVLQGVQRELLDAIIEAPVRDGKQVLCGVRMAVAVTTGRFLDDFETVLTRAKFKGFMFRVDIPQLKDDDGKGIRRSDVFEFVGAYLNACRLGTSTIDTAYDSASSIQRTSGQWVENACDRCKHKDECRGSFGMTTRGHGLYPFNDAALERMIRARCGDDFDPREILGQIVQYTLGDNGENIRNGRFPSAQYAERFKTDKVEPISSALENALKGDTDPRRLPLVVLWGGNPAKPVNLSKSIHRAFQITLLTDVTQVEKKPVERLQAPTELRTSSAMPTWAEGIDKWKDDTAQLDQALARRLRNMIAAAISERIDWNDFCVPSLNAMKFDATGVRIKKAAGEGRAIPPIHIVIEPSAETAQAFHALMLFDEHGSWKFEGGATYLRHLSWMIDRWAAEVRAQYRAPAEDAAAQRLVEQMVEFALFGARVLNLRGSRSDKTADLVNAVFEKASDLTYVKPSPPTWQALEAAVALGPTTQERTRRELLDRLLFHVGRSQGTGRPVAIDVSAIMDAIGRMKRSWQLSELDADAPDWLRSLYNRVAPHVEPAISAEVQRLAQWSARFRSLFPENKTINDAVKEAASAIERADDVARGEGVRRPGDTKKMEELKELVRELQLPTSGFGQVASLWKFLERVESASMGEKLLELSADRKRQMHQLQRFVELASVFLDDTGARVSSEYANVHTAEGNLGPTIQVISDQLDEAIGLLSGASGGEP